MLLVENLCKRLNGFSLRGISFSVPRGGYFVLLGASGAGKTLVLEMLAGALDPDSGRICWNGEDISRERMQSRRMGLVYQDQALFPHMRARANIAYPMRGRNMRREEIAAQTRKLAEKTGAHHLLERYPGTLSGGERQRVALARAMAANPRCLLLDEPLSSLDVQSRARMRALLRDLHRQGNTIVHVTHDYEEAISLATQVGIMEAGEIVQTGDPVEVFHHPKSEFIARFTGIRNVFKGRLEPVDGVVSRFIAGPLEFIIAGNGHAGGGCVVLRSEDITLSRSQTHTSAQNCFGGVVTDIARSRSGTEVTVDTGAEIVATITSGSLERLELQCGQPVWLSFKATAARFVEA